MPEISRRSALAGAAALAGAGAFSVAQSGIATATTPTSGGSITVPAPGKAKYPIHFRSSDQLAAYTRYGHLKAHGPLVLADGAGRTPHGPWPESALESAQNVLATSPNVIVGVDFRMTADGKSVAISDETLDRVTNGRGKVSALRARDITKLNLVNSLGQTTQFKVRETREFLTWAVKAGAILWLDVNDASPDFVVNEIRAAKAEAQVVITIEGRTELEAFRKLAPELVYFVPTHADGLPDAPAIRRAAADLDHVIGFAGHYVPNVADTTKLRGWDVPTVFDLTRYDRDLASDQLDEDYYKAVRDADFRIVNTSHYAAVTGFFGTTAWNPQSKIQRSGRRRG